MTKQEKNIDIKTKKISAAAFKTSLAKGMNLIGKNDTSIQAKLIKMFVIIVVIMAGVSLATFIYFNRATDTYDEMMENIIIANNIIDDNKQVTKEVQDYMFKPEPAVKKQIEDLNGIIDNNILVLQGRITDEETLAALDGVYRLNNTYKNNTNEIVAFIDNKQLTEAIDILDDLKKINGFIEDEGKRLITHQLRFSSDVRQQMKTQQTIMAVLVLGMIVAIGIISTIYALRFSKKLAGTIKAVALEAVKISKGDLNVKEVSIDTNDELKDLSVAFNTMAGNLRAIIKQLAQNSIDVSNNAEQLTASAEQSSKASEQIAATIQQMAHGAVDQSEQSAVTAEAAKKILTSSQKIADNSLTATETSNLANETASAGNEKIKSVIDQINILKEQMDATAKVTNKLNERSKEIGEIVEVITNIASQTNLLALNAAIEAARAGEHGRGFAVVADEVRKLAEGSASAANKITKMIEEIKEDTISTAENMEKGIEEVNLGTKLTQEAGAAFEDIVRVIQIVNEQINGIDNEIKDIVEQIKTVENLSGNITVIARQSSAGSQEVAAAVEEQTASLQEIVSSASVLSQMAVDLRDIVNKFQL